MKKINRGSILAVLVIFSILGLTGPNVLLAAGPAAVNLGTAGNFVILTKTGISTTGSTSIVGDLGVSPVAATYLTGFALTLPAASAFSTSALVTGKIYASDYANPTPANLTTAVSDMETAYTDGAGRTNPTATELGAGNIGGLTIAPGLYKWGTGVTIPTDVTLSGTLNDVWIFQIAQGLSVSSGVSIQLAGGAQASNIFWIVAGQTTIETTAVFNGNILDQTAIVLNTGARLNGRALAQTAVTLDSNTVSQTSSSAPAPVPAPAPSPSPSPTPAPSTTTSGTQSSSQTSVTPSSQSVTTIGSLSADPRIALQERLNVLVAQLQTLQASSASNFGQQVRSIATSMSVGSRGANVRILQEFLISQNKGVASQALARVGTTAYFGPMTRSALAEFQANVGIKPALGNFGPITRAYIGANF